MNSTPQPFTRSRIAALVVIGLLACGLGYLRFAPDPASVTVPAGAHAGQLNLEACHYDTDEGSYAADCGKLIVPENRANPRTRLIAVPIIRIHARSEHPREPIFRLEGGPGLTNMEFSKASRFAEEHDVVLVGYRGADGSQVLDCPEVSSALKHSADLLGRKSLHAYSAAFRTCANRLRSDGVDLAGYSVPQRVDDFEAARRALGYRRIDLISESAGTRTAMIYAWRYPSSIHRSVMIGANPPGHLLWGPTRTDEQIRRYAVLCAQAPACRTRTPDLAATLRRGMAHIPDHWGPLPIKKGNVRVATFYGLMESTSEAAPISGPITSNAWLSAAHGDASGLWFQSLMADFAFPTGFDAWGEMAAFGRIDADAADRYFSAARHPRSILGDPGTTFIWGGGGLAHSWPAQPDENEYDRVRTSHVETLVIGGSLDGTTPPQNATRELMPHLPNGHQVVLGELGHTIDFWSYQPEASSRLVNAFLDSGKVDTSLYRHRTENFKPEVTQTALAKGIAGTMVGLAIITLFSLAWMPRRVHKRGRFGRVSSALLRSLHPIVLGLGGWFLAALVVITTRATVPLDSEAMGIVSIGIPVGLGIYWVWLKRDYPTTTRVAGLSAAAVGALAGGWFGFGALTGLGAILTTTVGAAAGANLALIGFDVSRIRAARRLHAVSVTELPVPAERSV
jgi:pimeloyl-ACP methyl ester carboxylesterase